MIRLQGREYAVNPGETVLEALLRQNIPVPYSCRNGDCQSCMMKCVEGVVPLQAQEGLKETYQANGYFLSCVCVPKGDMTVDFLDAELEAIPAQIIEKDLLNTDIVRLILKPQTDFTCKAGQFVTLLLPDGHARSYSIANLPRKEGALEIHIKRHAFGKMSQWAFDEADVGDMIHVRGPAGTCFYVPSTTPFDMVLAGAGTGLSPLYGIILDALEQGHQGSIKLLYGALKRQDFYYLENLERLSKINANFQYDLCVKDEGGGDLVSVLEKTIVATPQTRFYCCGSPDLVHSLKQAAFLSGVASKNILSDSFSIKTMK